MKITIVQGAFLPVPTLRGGAVEKMWFELGKQFVSKGHYVTHISRRFSSLPSNEIIEGVKHVRVNGFDWPSNPLLLKLLDLFYSLHVLINLPRADILICNTFWLPILASPFQSLFGLIVVDVQRIPKGQMFLYSFVAALRANSSSVRQAILKEAPYLSAKIVTIPNPLPYVAPPLALVNRQKVILYCGRLHPEKGIELLLRAFEVACLLGLKNWSLRLVGSSDIQAGGGGSSWINRLVKEQRHSGLLVEWIGPLYDERELQLQYNQASIFVYPSLADNGESFGMAPLEAMAFGAVPIVSSVVCFQDFIVSGENGLIFNHRSSNSDHKLASAILDLVNNQSFCQQLSERALAVRTTHHPTAISEIFLRHFSALLVT